MTLDQIAHDLEIARATIRGCAFYNMANRSIEELTQATLAQARAEAQVRYLEAQLREMADQELANNQTLNYLKERL